MDNNSILMAIGAAIVPACIGFFAVNKAYNTIKTILLQRVEDEIADINIFIEEQKITNKEVEEKFIEGIKERAELKGRLK